MWVMIESLRALLGTTITAAVGMDQVPALRYLLRSQQNILWQRYEWPHLRCHKTFTLSAGQRYYDVPEGINFGRIAEVQVYWSGRPEPVGRGIGFSDYAVFNPDLDERADPVRKWDLVRVAPAATQIEVWPVPGVNGVPVGIRSVTNLRQFNADADVCDLDDDLIVYEVAVQKLMAEESPAARRVKEQAEYLRNALIPNYEGGAIGTVPGHMSAGAAGSRRGATVVVAG
jgi:hypothetical protein